MGDKTMYVVTEADGQHHGWDPCFVTGDRESALNYIWEAYIRDRDDANQDEQVAQDLEANGYIFYKFKGMDVEFQVTPCYYANTYRSKTKRPKLEFEEV